MSNSPKYLTSDVIGTGGFGCVIWPALVFYNSDIVNDGNRDLFVTKLGSDAANYKGNLGEYDKATFFQSIIPDVGIFPVDLLVCGLGPAELKDILTNPDSEAKCSRVLKDLWRTEVQEHYGGHYDKHSFEGLHGGHSIDGLHGGSAWSTIKNYFFPQHHVSPKRYAQFANTDTLCAIQYPKYDEDLMVFSKNSGSIRLYNKFAPQLITKLRTMHNANIVHLDIKLQNLCHIDDQVFFADWGFAQYLDNKDIESIKFIGEHIGNKLNYYITLAELASKILPYDHDIDRRADGRVRSLIKVCSRIEMYGQRINHEDNLSNVIVLLKDIDKLLLASAIEAMTALFMSRRLIKNPGRPVADQYSDDLSDS